LYSTEPITYTFLDHRLYYVVREENILSAEVENTTEVKTVGLIVNPVAGMGGAVGLKGTDGKIVLKEAISLGAKPIAPARAELFLSRLNYSKDKIKLLVGAGSMGEYGAKNCGLAHIILGERKKETNAEDTIAISRMMADKKVDLLVFCGGDGTARDIQKTLGMTLPVLGVPTGVKMHSAVFAVNPQAAAYIVNKFLLGELPLKEVEIMDINERAFREDRLSAELYGYVLTPYEPHLVQGNKMTSLITKNELRNQAAIAIYIIENMKPDIIYVIGPGTTTRTIGDLLDEKKSLLGVDLFYNKKITAYDVNEKQILEAIKGKTAQIIVTPIGGQGFIFGRGNQQISPEVIRRIGVSNIIVIATVGKLGSLMELRVDTGDPNLDATLRSRKIKVVTDYKIEYTMQIK
jgi:predicted polyphosphate/ATP-dependent NAD kinase